MISIVDDFFKQINGKIDSFKKENNLINIPDNLFEEDITNLLSNSIQFIYSGKYVDFLKNNNSDDLQKLLESQIGGSTEELSLIDDNIIQNRVSTLFNTRVREGLREIMDNCIMFFLYNVSELVKFKQTIIHRNFKFLETENKTFRELYEYCNIYLLEYLIDESIEYYEKLKSIEERIDEFHKKEPFKKLQVIKCKAVFLKYKWKKRQKYNRIFIKENIDVSFSKAYIFQNEEVDLSTKILIGDEFYSFFKDWAKKIELHYFDIDGQLIDEYSKTSLLQPLDPNLQLKDDFKMFYTIKYFKDLEPSFEKLESFKETIKSSSLSKKNKLYFLNNLFSSLTKKDDAYERTVLNYFTEIKNYSNRQQSNNYFIYYKFLDYKLDVINKKLNSLSFEELELQIKECEELFKESNKKFEWTYKSFNILYQFDKEDCLIKIEEESIYFPTSFLLPISITENKHLIAKKLETINDLKYKLIELKNHKYNQTIENQIKDSEKKSIATISLFTAVISFIMGSISGFRFVDNIYNAIAFVVIFGICLSIFLVLILKLVRKDNSYNILEFLPVFIMLVILVIAALSISEKNVVSKENLKDELIKLNILPNKD